jgi:hypothetical protein
MGMSAKGASLLGFVRLAGVGGLDMRFLGRKWQKKKADPYGMTRKGQERRRRRGMTTKRATEKRKTTTLWSLLRLELVRVKTHISGSRCGAPGSGTGRGVNF